MTDILLHGCNGRMGQMIAGLAAEDPEVRIAAGVDAWTGRENPFPVFEKIDDCDVKVDVVVDFSNAGAADALLDWCVRTKTPVVLCTTGLSPEQLARVEEAAGETAVLKSANMSVGINLLLKLLKEAAPKLAAAGFDIEIVEKHHNQKLDAPAAPLSPWRTRSMRPAAARTIMSTTGARCVRRGTAGSSAFPRCAAARSWAITM